MQSIVDTSGDYELVQDTFTADKKYQYLTIGYFPAGRINKSQYRIPDLNNVTIDMSDYDKHAIARFAIDEIQIFEILDNDNLQKVISNKLDIKNIQFETNKATLTILGTKEVDKLINLMVEILYLNIIIEGHTDDEGEDEFNRDLSNKRALEIFNYLIKKGINPDRLDAKGFGETNPLAPNINIENRTLNRRVEIQVKQ